MGGSLILIKSILENIPIYWMTLAKIPKSILDKIWQKCFAFLWSGNNQKLNYRLANWELISRPKIHGGWGINHIYDFGIALASKSL